MQKEMFIEYKDYSSQKVMIGLSGGINSMAVLLWLSQYPEEYKPKELHLFYAHFKEHSPDTEKFVLDGVAFAKAHFNNVFYEQTNNSVIEFFREQKMIPHPMVAPCTRLLKIEPMLMYMVQHKITIDLVGYVRQEMRRIKNMAKKSKGELKGDVVIQGDIEKHFPIHSRSDQWCFDICEKHIGWYPAIYDIKENGKRVFKHNNCLPCKNMNQKDFDKVQKYYPEYMDKANRLAEELDAYWGRGVKKDKEQGTQTCSICAFD